MLPLKHFTAVFLDHRGGGGGGGGGVPFKLAEAAHCTAAWREPECILLREKRQRWPERIALYKRNGKQPLGVQSRGREASGHDMSQHLGGFSSHSESPVAAKTSHYIHFIFFTCLSIL